MDNRRRQGSSTLRAGELQAGGSDGGGHGTSGHLHPQPLYSHTHQDYAKET